MTAKKHHYIPKGYLKAWTGADKHLCEYQRCRDRIVIKRRHPSETGWDEELYSIPNYPPEFADLVEEKLFQRINSDAAKALAVILAGGEPDPGPMLDGWARFLMSLMHRHPGRVAQIRAMVQHQFERNHAAARAAADNVGVFDEWLGANRDNLLGRSFAFAMEKACNQRDIGQILVNMPAMALTYSDPRHRLLTSDNPLFLSNGLASDKAFLMLPLSPRVLFVAARSDELLDGLRHDLSPDEQVDLINRHVVRRAQRFVYGLCENSRDFVTEYFGQDVLEGHDDLTATVRLSPHLMPSVTPLRHRRR